MGGWVGGWEGWGRDQIKIIGFDFVFFFFQFSEIKGFVISLRLLSPPREGRGRGGEAMGRNQLARRWSGGRWSGERRTQREDKRCHSLPLTCSCSISWSRPGT